MPEEKHLKQIIFYFLCHSRAEVLQLRLYSGSIQWFAAKTSEIHLTLHIVGNHQMKKKKTKAGL